MRDIVGALNLNTVSRATADQFLNGNELNSTAVADALAKAVDASESLDIFFVLVSAVLVFLMQAGFAMLTAGSVRTKNVKNVLLKNVLDACVGAIAYFLFGWAFAYGEGSAAPRFIGSGQYALSGGFGRPGASYGNGFHDFFFQWAFAATAATIVSGSVAERTSFYAYLGYAFVLTSFVYPVVSHWVWTEDGFLSVWGMKDFAGCAVVHMVGGFAGLVGAIIVGPRRGRFNAAGDVVPMPGHSATLVTLGTFVLWFGWYGFNPGSALALSDGGANTAERAAVTTTLAAASAGVVTLIIVKIKDHIFDLIAILNGILAGLVSITAACAWVEPWAAVVIGAIGALVYIGAAVILLKFKVDDPLEAFPIHGACGFWGVIAVGFFASVGESGLFGGGGARLLGINIAGALIIMVWTVVLVGTLFTVMKLAGILRIPPEIEDIGNDISKHGGTAYPADSLEIAEEAAKKEIDNLGMDESLQRPSEV